MKFFKFLGRLLLIIIILLLVLITAVGIYGYTISRQVLNDKSIETAVKEIRAKENFASIDQINPDFTNAIVSVEDRRFYMHKGFDPISFARALYINAKNQELEQGGSTITQQLVKNIYFTDKQMFLRKAAELFIALDFEKQYSKNDILELYVNDIYYGDGYYTIKEASQGYFKVNPIDLSLDQATMLAGVPNAPSAYSPSTNLLLAKKRQKHVINSMIENGYLTQSKADSLLNQINDYLNSNNK